MTRTITIRNKSQPYHPPIRARYCADFWSKFRGLMLVPEIPVDGGVLLVEERESKINSTIHMFFMRFDISVIWIDGNNRVVDVQIAHKWRPSYTPARPARYILEAHIAQGDKFKIGDQVEFIDE
jgi:uncharacterized membrane protein (UPF0127 family)